MQEIVARENDPKEKEKKLQKIQLLKDPKYQFKVKAEKLIKNNRN